ncbi:MAG: sugar phosphate isomerase/epimerase, partial [bacterium]|nr:sugar phosphate isomerase/epimerase [bacterium]
MKTSTTTLGCPGWDLATVVRNLADYGYDAVDFRGLGEALDITKAPEFTTGLPGTKRLLEDAGLAVSCISSSIRVCAPELLDENLEEARRTLAVAVELDAPGVRVFGGGDVEQCGREELAAFAADTMERILALDGAEKVRWGIETHDHWVAASDVRVLLDRIPDDRVGVVWDVGHTTRVENEGPEA